MMIVQSYIIVCICRCNNVLYLRGVPEDEEIEDAAEDQNEKTFVRRNYVLYLFGSVLEDEEIGDAAEDQNEEDFLLL